MKTVRFFFYIIVVLLFYGCSSNKYLTPQKYGAKANGETDCTASIREMLRNMKSGKIHKAKFPDGVYLISDSIIIDFPCRITGSKATIITKDTLIGKYAFKYTLSPKGQFQPNKERSELSLNFKIHGVPVAFHGYNNMYIHDCIHI